MNFWSLFRILPLFIVSLAVGVGNGRAETPTPNTSEALLLEKRTTLGPVQMLVRLTPPQPRIGDEIQLTIEVEAAADVEVLMPEFGEALDRYTVLDFVPRETTNSQGNVIHTQRYTLQPYVSGPQSIPPILVEFIDHRPGQKSAPDDLDAFEVLSDRIDFEVTSVLPSNVEQELRPPLGPLSLESNRTARNWFLAIVLGAVLVSALAWWGFTIWKRRQRRTRRMNAYEIARRNLNRLLGGPTPVDAEGVETFFVALSGIVRKYLEDRFELRAPELTTEEFLSLAAQSGIVSREHQSLLRDFLRQADLVKFAGVTASRDEIARSAELANRFLDETRENAPDVDVSIEEFSHA